MYEVNGNKFGSFFAAIAAAKAVGADVIEAETGARRWTPATKKATKTVRHVLVNKDGTQTEIGRVRY